MFLLVSIGIGMVLLLPTLYYLFSVFKLSTPAPCKEETVANEVVQEKSS